MNCGETRGTPFLIHGGPRRGTENTFFIYRGPRRGTENTFFDPRRAAEGREEGVSHWGMEGKAPVGGGNAAILGCTLGVYNCAMLACPEGRRRAEKPIPTQWSQHSTRKRVRTVMLTFAEKLIFLAAVAVSIYVSFVQFRRVYEVVRRGGGLCQAGMSWPAGWRMRPADGLRSAICGRAAVGPVSSTR